MPNLYTFRRYALLNADADEALMQLFLDAAMEWYYDSGVPKDASGAQWDLAVYMLATYYHDHREAIGNPSAEVPFGVMSFMHHLRLAPAESVPEGGAGEAGEAGEAVSGA